MAALCPGVQYGLSSQQNFGENKDLIFVKLTDSALRAIEDYIKNANKFSCQQRPTIKFLGNEGHLSFPSVQNGCTSFKFSMSTTADMEGPGGSFECVQQSGPPRGSLEVLGSIPYKVRVHANEDVYEATRHRMTIAEENHKNKCTREIKPNEKDIGRKVKLKQSRAALPPSIRRELGPPSQQQQQQQSRDNNNGSVTASSKPPSSYQSNLTATVAAAQNHKLSPLTSTNNGPLSNGFNGNHVLNNNNNNARATQPPNNNKPSLPDIARRPIKERLIHLLALKPFKKVELHDRLTKEGSYREKKGMSSILKQISFMKDNCYHLNRALWNEVNEDWPFYTETEKQILKRRKPQNLTPPGSSDGGSSGSGQSPTSTHPGSPPQSSKRPGYYDNLDGLPTKRQRISHYRKTPEQTTANYQHRSSPIIENNNGQRRPATDSRDASNMNPRSRESPPPPLPPPQTSVQLQPVQQQQPLQSNTNGYRSPTPAIMTNGSSTNGRANANTNHHHSDDERDKKVQVQPQPPQRSTNAPCDSHTSLGFGISRDATRPLTQSNSNYRKAANNTTITPTMNDAADRNGYSNGVMLNGKSRDKDRNRYEKVNSTWQDKSRGASISPGSPMDCNGHDDRHDIHIAALDISRPSEKLDNTSSEFPDYLTKYTTIKNAEQRRRYKSDFYADYDEYKDLHGIVEKVSRRFAELELRLKQEDASSPRHKDIKRQIVHEYNENKKDLEHQRAKRRFQYLHDKLSHIKRLVLEYDQSMVDEQY